jgi:hypothetical protein
MIKSVIHTRGLRKQEFRPLLCGLLAVFLIVAFAACTGQKERVDLSPANWAAGELEKYAELSRVEGQSQIEFGVNHLGTGRAGMVVGVTEALAVHAGLEALQQGGNAADAAMVTALSQVALHAGSVVSYAGIMSLLYYDAATGRVYAMKALYNTPSEEKDPLSIPAMGSGIPSGRTALVPGFMPGWVRCTTASGCCPLTLSWNRPSTSPNRDSTSMRCTQRSSKAKRRC